MGLPISSVVIRPSRFFFLQYGGRSREPTGAAGNRQRSTDLGTGKLVEGDRVSPVAG
jgi:hypothetical protein